MSLVRLGPIAHSSMNTMAVYVVRLAVQLALLLILARWLGPVHYGEFASVAALAMGLGTLSGCGLGFVVMSESACSAASGQAVLAKAVPATVLSAALLLPLYLWLAVAVIGSGAGLTGLGLIGVSELLLVPLLGLLSHRLHGLGFVALSQALALWPVALRLTGLVLYMALAVMPDIKIYAFVHAAGALVALALSSVLAAEYAQLPESLRWPDQAMLRHGARFATMHFTATVPGELDKTVALRLLGASGTGLYALASRGMAVVTLPVMAMLQAVLPRLIQQLHDPAADGQRLLWVALSLAALYGVAAATLLYLIASPLVESLAGPLYEGLGALVKKISLIAPFLSLRHATGTTLFALGRPMLRSTIEGAAVVTLILLALLLTPRFGLNGLVWAVLTSEAAMATAGMLAIASLLRHPMVMIPAPASTPQSRVR
jgi:O-antigen/teichoic acid export membrane protein